MTVSTLQGVGYACFGFSYLLAFLLELGRLAWPRPGWRAAALGWGLIGFAVHTFYVLLNPPHLAAPAGSLLVLAWVLAVVYLSGTVRHAKQAWAVFVLPVVLGLVALSFVLFRSGGTSSTFTVPDWATGDRFWGFVHGVLILLAAAGVSVAFLASVMYLVQARRLRNKVNPGRVVPMLSLERLETMNRHAVTWAFPFLTAGLLVGTILLRHYPDLGDNWLSLKVVTTAALWVVFLVLVYLRYGTSVPPRRLAVLSIAAFVILVVALAAAHPFADGGAR